MVILAVVVFVGFPCTLVAVGLLTFAICTQRHHRGYTVSLVALVLALASAVLTTPATVFALSSWAFYNRSATGGEIGFALTLGGIQALAVLGSLLSALRHRAHRRLEGTTSVSPTG